MKKPIPQSAQRDLVRKTVPALVEFTERVVYGEVWEREDLSKRDRSLVTVAALVASYRPEQLNTHIGRALDNGVTQEELAGLITHLAFYAGWPASMTAARVLTEVLEKRGA
ncbi:carboxymuconolactone decarboxylase family protein [Roseococcus sp.]|uniref:carboxymuconolactone decarboxylase family protein n=1 Tax=Roseococcus sp. TaxID=2109646 RepID=UPI003BA8D68B